MLRILLVIAWIAVTVYAIADWFGTSEEDLPAKLPKALWLVLIIVSIPSFSLGSIAWIIVRAVTRAEAGQSPLPPLKMPQFGQAPSTPTPAAPMAPDDDPEFLFKIERDIQREKRRHAQSDNGSAPQPSNSDGTEGAGAGADADTPSDTPSDTESNTDSGD